MEIKSEIIYFDENKNVTNKENAVSAIIRELDENGNLLREMWGNVSKKEGDE